MTTGADVDDAAREGERPPAAPRSRRGRESVGDMIRSLAVVMVLVVMMWFLAQPPDSDEQEIRVVDPTSELAAFTADVPSAPVPTGLPEKWRATSSTLSDGAVRVGYVTPEGAYAEYAASTAPQEDALATLVGTSETDLPDVRVDGEPWQQYRDGDALSLVRAYGPALVVVGSLRATASRTELEQLAASLQPAARG